MKMDRDFGFSQDNKHLSNNLCGEEHEVLSIIKSSDKKKKTVQKKGQRFLTKTISKRCKATTLCQTALQSMRIEKR